jgi:ribosomal protein S18 acetylase RimI-like enzyme
LKIEKLTSEHNRSAFNCGDEEQYRPLNDYIRLYATQNDRRHNTATYVLVPDDSKRVIGYYTITVKSLEAANVPNEEKLRGFPMPVALLARLARDKEFAGQGIGELLMVDALRRIGRAATEVGIRAIEVDAKNERARAFYEKYGFKPLLDDTLHLYLPIRVLLKSKLFLP